MKTTRVSTDYHITAEQMNKIKRSLTSALNAYSAEVTEKDVYQKAVAGLKYKSCNGKEVHLTVPKYSQKRKIEKHYLEGIRKHFNQSCDGKYTLIIHAEKKRRPWIPVTAGALAVAAGGAGTGIYYALQPNVGTVTVTMDLNGGHIDGISGNKIEVLEGSTYGELPSPIYDDESMIFAGWTKIDSNEPVVPSEKIEGDVSLKATYEPAPGKSATIEGGKQTIETKAGASPITDMQSWKLYVGTEPQTGVIFSIKGDETGKISINTNGQVTVGTISQAGAYGCQVVGETSDHSISASANLTVVVDEEDVCQAFGGSTTLNGKFGEIDTDDNAWAPYLNGEKQTASGYGFVETELPDGISIWNDGIVRWSNELAPGVYTFHVRVTDTEGRTYDSDTITLTIADVYEVKGGANSLIGVEGTAGSDESAPWQLYKNGAVVSSDVTYSLLNNYGQDISINNQHYLAWGNTVDIDTYTLNVVAKGTSGETLATSADIYLTIEPAHEQPIIIEGSDVVNASDPNVVFKAYTYPEHTQVTGLTWTVASWAKDPDADPSSTQPAFDTTTNGKLNSAYNCWGTGTIQATDEESNVVATMPITVHPPFVDSDGYWGVFNRENPGSEIWGEYDIDTLAPEVEQVIPPVEPDTQISYRLLGSSTDVKVDRDAFNNSVAIGSKVAYVPDNFLRNCTALEEWSVEFPSDSQCVMIGDSFMHGCDQMHNYIHLPNKLIRIGDEFMKGCSVFGGTGVSVLTIPNSLEEIGDDFLYECASFNQDLTIPASVTTVGNEFMFGCDGMVSTLTINADYLAFKADGGMPMSFATYTEHPAWEADGFKVSGVQANINGLIGNFGPIVYSPSTNCIRKLVYVAPEP